MVRRCRSQKTLIGKTVIVTGANTGIGYAAAMEFAKRGARVILACRSVEKGEEACRKLKEATDNQNIVFRKLDLESLQSVREFAQEIIDTEDRLDLLINNAGSAYLPEKLTDDGLLLQMQVNYFSHFLLTNLLLDLLKKSAPSRVINVSSSAAKISPALNTDKLNESPGTHLLYPKTKLCNILFTIELAKRLEGTDVTSYSLHPGAVATDGQRFSKVFSFIAHRCFLSAEDGAQTTLYCSLEDDLEKYNGRHFEDCAVVKTYGTAKDPALATKLWEVSEKLVGLTN